MIIRILSLAAFLAAPLALSADEPTGKLSTSESRAAAKERAKLRLAAKEAAAGNQEERERSQADEKERAQQAERKAQVEARRKEADKNK